MMGVMLGVMGVMMCVVGVDGCNDATESWVVHPLIGLGQSVKQQKERLLDTRLVSNGEEIRGSASAPTSEPRILSHAGRRSSSTPKKAVCRRILRPCQKHRGLDSTHALLTRQALPV